MAIVTGIRETGIFNQRELMPPPGNVSWRVIPINDEWTSMFYSFKHTAFRLETLQWYAEPSESSPFNLYQRGIDPGPSHMDEWCETITKHMQFGRSMRRVHVVDLPLCAYMRFEVECCYRFSGSAGEEIRLIDRATLSPELQELCREDFWFFDNATVMINDYNSGHTLYQARITTDPRAVAYYSDIEKKIWALGVPFREFHETHTGDTLAFPR